MKYIFILIVLLASTKCFADVIQKNEDGTFAVSSQNVTQEQRQLDLKTAQDKVIELQYLLDQANATVKSIQSDLDVMDSVSAGATVEEAKASISAVGVKMSPVEVDKVIY